MSPAPRQSAPWVSGAKKTSGSYVGGKPKLLLHATISPAKGVPGYNAQSEAPHVTITWDGQNIHPYQHYYWDNFAKALANLPGGVETNRLTVLQVELAGYLTDRAGQFNILKAPQSYWIQVGNFLKPVAEGWRIPNVAPGDWTVKGRMSMNTWNAFSGLCAHVHAPENDHWDLPLSASTLSLLRSRIWPVTPPTPIPPTPSKIPSYEEDAMILIVGRSPYLLNGGILCPITTADKDRAVAQKVPAFGVETNSWPAIKKAYGSVYGVPDPEGQ